MNIEQLLRSTVAIAAPLVVTATGWSQVENLRITEVDPLFDEVEVTNFGPAYTATENHPFCYRIQYAAVIPMGTVFGVGESLVFSASGLAQDNSDLWIYTHGPFTNGDNMVHGLRWGPDILPGRTSLGVKIGIWPSDEAFVATPPLFHSIAWDGVGLDPLDWYIDETPTLGTPDVTTPGVVPSSLVFPCSEQNFESMLYGDEIIAIDAWSIANTSPPGVFTVRSVRDVNGVTGPRPGSTSSQWLRVRDQDNDDVINRLDGPIIVGPETNDYAWSLWINLEETPPSGGTAKPGLMIQHRDGAFADAWGIEFADTGASLVVTGIGGPPASTLLYALAPPTDLGDWVKLTLHVSFDTETIAATVNDGTPATLPIGLSPTADPAAFRVSYRGDGDGNVGTMLIDDVAVRVGAAVNCLADIDCSGAVDFGDILAVLGAWGEYELCPPYRAADVSRNCSVDFADVLAILGGWGACE